MNGWLIVGRARRHCSKCNDRVQCVDVRGEWLCVRRCYDGPRTREPFEVARVSETELAWAAGFFDGEGSIFVNHVERSKHRDRVGCPVYRCTSPVLSIAHVRREPLDRFCVAVGGRVRGPYKPRTAKAKPYHRWEASGRASVHRVITLLWRYLSAPKREQTCRVWVELEACRGKKSPYLPPLPVAA